MKWMTTHHCRTAGMCIRAIAALLTVITVAVSAAPPRLALIWPTQVESLKDVRSLVEIELTRGDQVALLERSELEASWKNRKRSWRD